MAMAALAAIADPVVGGTKCPARAAGSTVNPISVPHMSANRQSQIFGEISGPGEESQPRKATALHKRMRDMIAQFRLCMVPGLSVCCMIIQRLCIILKS